MNRSAVLFALVSLAATTFLFQPTHAADVAPQVAKTTAVWKPFGSYDPLERQVRLADALIDRGLAELAVEELAEISDEELQGATPSNRALYGVASIRATLETARLTSREDRENVARTLASIREKLAVAVGAETANFELALVRAYYALGVLAIESGAEDEAAPYLGTATDLAKNAVGALPNDVAKPFLYWHAKATLARRDDPNRFAQAEKVAAALERSSARTRDEYYFYARLLLIESAREQGASESASQRIAETLDALSAVAQNQDAPFEIAVGLAAEETKALVAEGKLDEAVRTAARNSDLLDAPYPPNRGRYVDKLLDLFADLELTRVKTFWVAVKNAPEGKDDDLPTNLPNKEALVDAARLAASELRSNVQRSRASLFANAAGQASGDWLAIQTAAEENFRIGAWDDAIAGYDRAAQEADASGAANDAFRLRGVAASVADKVCREKLFDQTNQKDSVAWEQDARRRFEELARSNPEDKLAPSFYLLALEHAQNAGEEEHVLNKLRLDYLTLFPDAENRAEYALDLARRLLASADYDGAEIALDAIPSDASVLPDALETERVLYKNRVAQTPETSPFITTIVRLLGKTAINAPDVASLDDLSAAIVALAQTVSKSELSQNDSLVLDLIVELALDDDAHNDAKFAAALDDLLDAWEERVSAVSTVAKIRSYRLSLAVDTKSPQEIVAIFNSVDGSSSTAALDALDRLVSFADQAQGETRKRLAQFALDSIDKLRVDKTQADRVAVVKADALRLIGQGQEALRLYASQLKKDAKNARVLKGLALLLSNQTDAKALELAVKYWSDYADLNPDASPEWWNAKEKCVEIYCKLGKKDQAEKMLKTLWLTRTDPSDPNRKARWEKTIKAAR